jgi:hypothetical protein
MARHETADDRRESDPDWHNAEEARRRDPGDAPGLEAFNALLRRTLAMPPKPHSEMKLGKPRRPKRAKPAVELGVAPKEDGG